MKAALRRARFLPELAAVFAAGLLAGRALRSPVFALLAALPSLPLLLFHGRRQAGALLLALAMAAALGWAAWHPQLPAAGDYTVTGVVCDEITTGSSGSCRTRLTHVTLDGSPVRGDGYWTFYPKEETLPEELRPGVQVTFGGRVYAPEGAKNPGGFDFREYLLSKGVTYGLYGCADWCFSAPPRFSLAGMAAAARHVLTERLTAAMGNEAGGYAAALLLGTRTLIPESDRQAFRRLGLAHVLAVSGFHTGILAALIGLLLKRTGPAVRFAVQTAVLFCYAALTGANPPVVRAALLLTLSGWGRLRHRRPVPAVLLCTSFLLSLLWRPAQLLSASFQMTYGALAGLLLAYPSVRRLLPFRNGFAGKAADAVCAAVCAQLGVMLPLICWYQELPLAGLLLSPAVLAFSSLLIAADWLCLALCAVPAAGPALGAVCGLLTRWLTGGVRLLAEIPFFVLRTRQAGWLTAAGWALLLLGLCPLWTDRAKRRGAMALCGAAVMAVSLVTLPHRGCDYTQLSVGNADAAVLRDGRTVTVIDTGTDGQALSSWLTQRGIFAVDRVFLTHLHSDHAGGLRSLMDDGIRIGEIILPEGAETQRLDPGMETLPQEAAAAGIPVRHAAAGDAFPLPSGSLTVLWPEPDGVRPLQDANRYSLTLQARLNGASMLLTGDLDGLYELYAAVPSDILKVAHHGSTASTSLAFLEAVAPQLAIVSCRDAERQRETEQRLGGIPLAGTAVSGALTIHFEAEGQFTVTGYLP